MILPYELTSIINDMQRAMDAKLYYPALLVALTLPEICAGLAKTKSQKVGSKDYMNFIDRYTSPEDIGGNGEEIYRLRGGLVHRGNLKGHDRQDATHIIFTLPDSDAHLHAKSIHRGEQLADFFDLKIFTNEMVAAVHNWYKEHSDNKLVRENLPHLIRYSASGVFPFTQGIAAVVSGI